MKAAGFISIMSFILGCALQARAESINLDQAHIVVPPGLAGPEKKAITMLVEEVQKRSQIVFPTDSAWPNAETPVIAVGKKTELEAFAGSYAKELREAPGANREEGFRLCVKREAGRVTVFVIGNDARGVLFGLGRLLLELRFGPKKVSLEDNLDVTTAPLYPLRGHQLGFRPKCNSYDAWDLPAWEQYFRDLAVFGSNAIELIPPRSDDDGSSPHFPRPPMEMMIGMSQLAKDYGLSLWIWYPAMDKDYSDPKTVEFALKEWSEVFSQLPRIDAVFVPGGDPGHTEPKHLMRLLEKQTENLHRHHPQAQMWVSPQSFNQEWLKQFLDILDQEHPAWLSGIVYGPQVRTTLPELRKRVPPQYPIRHYPDITHSRQCQYPVRDWDVAYAITEARECINPRPEAETAIFRATQPFTMGFLSYSEGCNDDVNKFIWSSLGWNAESQPIEMLRQYARYFIGERYEDNFAQGLLALERNWQGSLLANENVETTLKLFQSMEKNAAPAELKNWRFQQALFRAYYDAYTRRRLIYETELEARAMDFLRRAPSEGSLRAMAAAEKTLEDSSSVRVAEDWRMRILELGEALFQSIGMQLSVDKYRAIAVDRGASLDTLDYPLNNRVWLRERFVRIRQINNEVERLQAIDALVNWTNPGPGGFYDDLGNVARQSHLVRGPGLSEDPGSMSSPRVGFEEDLVVDEDDEKPQGARRMSWIDHAESLYDAPLQMQYANLDPQARYKVRVVYAGDNPKRKIRLVANQNIEVHPYLSRPVPFRPLDFDLPARATQGGTLTLSWYGESGLGGNGRGCQVSEIWLMKQDPAPRKASNQP